MTLRRVKLSPGMILQDEFLAKGTESTNEIAANVIILALESRKDCCRAEYKQQKMGL